MTTTERTPAELIAYLQSIGELDPTCQMCIRLFYPELIAGQGMPFAPGHKASRNCESGKRPHCSCSVCF